MAKQVTVLKAAKSVDFVKALRTAADLGLSEAVGLAEFISTNAPCVVVAGIDAAVAAHVQGLFQAAGVESEIQDSSISFPMLLWPEAGQRHRWTWLGTKPVA